MNSIEDIVKKLAGDEEEPEVKGPAAPVKVKFKRVLKRTKKPEAAKSAEAARAALKGPANG